MLYKHTVMLPFSFSAILNTHYAIKSIEMRWQACPYKHIYYCAYINYKESPCIKEVVFPMFLDKHQFPNCSPWSSWCNVFVQTNLLITRASCLYKKWSELVLARLCKLIEDVLIFNNNHDSYEDLSRYLLKNNIKHNISKRGYVALFSIEV